MFTVCLTILALVLGLSDAAQGRRQAAPAIPRLITLANFTEVLEEAVSCFNHSGSATIDTEPFVVRPAYLRLWSEMVILKKFRVFGCSNFSVQDIHQVAGDKTSVYFTLSVPELFIRGKADFVKGSEGGQIIVSGKDTETQFRVHARVVIVKGRPLISSMTVARSDVPSKLRIWTSAPVDPLDKQIIEDVLRKIPDTCVAHLAEQVVEATNDMLRGRTVFCNHKLSEKVAVIVAKRLRPEVQLTPFDIKRTVRCMVNNHEVVLRKGQIDTLENCTFVQPAKDGPLLHLVAKCDPIQFSSNVTIIDPKRNAESHDVKITLGISVFTKLHLQEQQTRQRRIRIARIILQDAYVFQYNNKAVSPSNMVGDMAAECLKRFIFIDWRQLMQKVLRFERK